MAELCFDSHQKAIAAQEVGEFDREIVHVDGHGVDVTVERDEGPRADTSVEKIESLKPVFSDGGFVTAGNSSQISDGVATVFERL